MVTFFGKGGVKGLVVEAGVRIFGNGRCRIIDGVEVVRRCIFIGPPDFGSDIGDVISGAV